MWHKDSIKLYSLGAFALIITLGLYWNDYMAEWKGYQDQFRSYVTSKFGAERAAQIPSGLQQIWVKDLDRVDRCTTCHQGIEWKGLESAPNPFKAHPKGILEKHPLSQYGCTSCHGGQGFATTVSDAHGFAAHWEEPLLGKRLSETYLVKDAKALMQVNCNACHRYDRETKGADYINLAKQLVEEKNCRSCHIINGRGGVIGPDLTNVGDKSPEQYDYGRVAGKRSAFAWHSAHFQSPKSVSEGTVMPDFNFSTREAQALTLLALSWRKTNLPPHYISGAVIRDRRTPEEIAKEKEMMEGEGGFFVTKGCFTCHSVNSLGVTSASKIGPDLSDAVVDVQRRFGRTLEDFLRAPTGTMAVVLSTQIPLTDEEKRLAVEKLKIAYQRKLEQEAQPKASPAAAPPAAKPKPGAAEPKPR